MAKRVQMTYDRCGQEINGYDIKISSAKLDLWGVGTPKAVFLSVAGMVNLLPSADVAPVVRCKDCQHFKDEEVNGQYCQYHTKNAGENCDGAFWVAKNDYCSYGERREE